MRFQSYHGPSSAWLPQREVERAMQHTHSAILIVESVMLAEIIKLGSSMRFE